MKRTYLILMTVAMVFAACKKSGPIIPVPVDNSSIGKAAEVLLVMDKNVWDTTMQDSVFAILTQPQPATNQVEPMFDVLQLNEELFTDNKLRHFNILHFQLDTNLKEAKYSLERNNYSNPQVYVEIRGANQDSCFQLFLQHQDDILAEFYENDIRKIQNAFTSIPNVEVQEKIRQKFGILLTVPKDYNIAREGDDYLWLLYRTVKNDRCIMIYKSPTSELTRANMIYNRNRIFKNIEGEHPEYHPVVVELGSLPFIFPMQIGAHQGAEMRGLWEMNDDWMGGPFYHYSFITPNNETISIDGFVYAPEEEKRDYIRQVESIVKSIK